MRVRQAQLSMMSNAGLGMPVDSMSTPMDNTSLNSLLVVDPEALIDDGDDESSSVTSPLGVQTHGPSPGHKLAVPALPAIVQTSMTAVRSAGSASPYHPDALSHSIRNPNSSLPSSGLDASALPSVAAAVSPESDQDHNHATSGRNPRADMARQPSKRRPSHQSTSEMDSRTSTKQSISEMASRTSSKCSVDGSSTRRRSKEGRSISCERVHLEVPAVQARRSSIKPSRKNSKDSSFQAFRARRMQTQEIEAMQTKEMDYKMDGVNEARLARKYGIDTLDVQRLLRQFHGALPADVDAKDGCLSLSAVQLLICKICDLPSGKSLPAHLMEADWNSALEDYRVGPEGLIAWWKNHQWCEETMVPSSEERKVRQFCRDQGYELLDVERVKAAFDKADQDGSGKLELAEFRAAVASLQGTASSEINGLTFLKLWKEVDADSSGTVELLEFAKWYLQNS